MANKFHKDVTDFRKAVKALPKNPVDAFEVTPYEYNNVTLEVIEESVVSEKRGAVHTISLSVNQAANEEVSTPAQMEIKLTEEQYLQYKERGETAFVKDIVVYDVVLCEALQTIGRVLGQELFAEQKILFKDSEFAGLQIDDIAYVSEEDYKKKLGERLGFMKKGFGRI